MLNNYCPISITNMIQFLDTTKELLLCLSCLYIHICIYNEYLTATPGWKSNLFCESFTKVKVFIKVQFE